MIKKLPFFLVMMLFAKLSLAQSLQGALPYLGIENHPVSFTILGTETHFNSSDSNLVTFYNNFDTVEFWSQPLSFYAHKGHILYTNHYSIFQSAGIYNLMVYNNIDDTLYLDSALRIIPGANNTYNIYDFEPKMVTAGDQGEMNFQVGFANAIISATNPYWCFVNKTSDTIHIDSVTQIDQWNIKTYFTVPADYHGLFKAVFRASSDTVMLSQNDLLIINDDKTQISELSPDSIHNMSWQPWEITIYGNKTHFTQDSTYIASQDSWMFDDCIDSMFVINDTTIIFYITLPMAIKAATHPNLLVYVYNETDGLMYYPMRVDIYGSTPEQEDISRRVKIYPNPAQNVVTIEHNIDIQEVSTLEIFNINGVKVYQDELRGSTYQFDVGGWQAGIYFGRLYDSNTENKSFKFIVQ